MLKTSVHELNENTVQGDLKTMIVLNEQMKSKVVNWDIHVWTCVCKADDSPEHQNYCFLTI